MNRSTYRKGRPNNFGVPPQCDRKDPGHNPKLYIFCSKYYGAYATRMSKKMK